MGQVACVIAHEAVKRLKKANIAKWLFALSPIDAKTSHAKTPSKVLKCVLQGMARMQQKPLGAVRNIKKVIVLSAIFF